MNSFTERKCNWKEGGEKGERSQNQVHGTSLFRPCEESARNSSDTRRRLAPVVSNENSLECREQAHELVPCVFPPRNGNGNVIGTLFDKTTNVGRARVHPVKIYKRRKRWEFPGTIGELTARKQQRIITVTRWIAPLSRIHLDVTPSRKIDTDFLFENVDARAFR